MTASTETPERRSRGLLPILIGYAAASKDDECVRLIAAAIREAVAAERERAAVIADTYGSPRIVAASIRKGLSP